MSSIFGNASSSGTSQPARASTLFGNSITASPATSQALPAGNLFGNVNTSQPQAQSGSSSLFGNTSNTLQSQPKSLIFGGTAEQPKPGLFAGQGTTQPQQQSTAPSGGFFGGATTVGSQSAQSSNLFGSAPVQGQNVQNPIGQAQAQPAQQGSIAGNVQPGYFDNLLEKSRKRNREADGRSDFQELPSLQLNLDDIAKRARQLGGIGSQSRGAAGNESGAHYLLAASGVNPGTTRRDLDSFAAQQSFGGEVRTPPDFDPDTHRYLEQRQEQMTQRMINEGLERAHQKFNEYIEERVDINWDLQRKRIYEHFGLTPREIDGEEFAASSGRGAFGKSSRRSRLGKSLRDGRTTMNRSIFGQSSIQKSVLGSPGSGAISGPLFSDVADKTGAIANQDDRYMREKQRKYAEKIQALNQARLQVARSREISSQGSYSLLREIQQLESQPGSDAPKQIADAYNALIEITGEPKAKERQFAGDYLHEDPQSPQSARVRKRILNGSRRSLEKSFLEQLLSVVAKNPREANIGGVPTAINQIRAYIRIRFARKDLVPDGQELFFSNGDYCWALLFFCLRCGLVKEAADYVTENAVHFRTFDKNIITYLTNYVSNPERRLDRKLQSLCNNVYTSLSKADAIDPFRVACYKIIGRCDLIKRNIDNINQGVEDWIWLQFCLAREVNRAEENAGEVCGLEEVRETIREIGQRHFAKGAEGTGGYGTFFLLQVLGGMFEEAVAYLYSYSYIAAVHFAIALDYYGLLRVSDFSVSETELCECASFV